MAAEINCPMCGKPNPAELNVCQYCEARLKPLTDELSRSQPPIRPGEEPEDVDTGQLESVLPQWLRDIRRQAQESADEEAGQPAGEEEAGKQEEKADLLAGLKSQSERDEEIPDWLAGLRKQGGQVDFEEASKEEDDVAALKNMLGEDAPVSEESEASALPSWFSDLSAEETGRAGPEELSAFLEGDTADESLHQESQPSPSGSDFRWDAGFETDSAPQAESPEGEMTFDAELPAWLQDTGEAQTGESDTGLPAWLGSEEPSRKEGGSTPLGEEGELPAWLQDRDESPKDETDSGLPAWLKSEKPASLEQENVEAGQPPSIESAIKSTTDWLASLDEETTQAAAQQETAGPAGEGEMPDWLSSLGKESPEQISPQESEEATIGDLPGWLAALGEEGGESFPQEGVQASGESETPAWLSSSAEKEEDIFPTGEEFVEPSQAPTEGETGTPSAFVDDEGRPISKEDVEAIFSMDMPDWLSDAGGASDVDTTQPTAEAQADELRPAELPSWVQAMRPVESVISETEATPSEEQPIEEQGPLAGLRGVLPAVPGVGLSSKPKKYSIKLEASDDQQASATLLEKMLAEEITPKPIVSHKAVRTQRLLRLAIAVLFLAIVAATIFSGTSINPIPTSVLPETKAVLDYIQTTLPANAPVLLIFDYEAARTGELEAAAAPVVDQMLTLKSPRLSLVSSTPTGLGLAERFMKLLQSDREYGRNEKFVNLGYLPGGAAGVQAFSRDPVTTKPLSTTGENAWTTPVLQDVKKLSDFKAIFLLTDNVETARIWIEQTQIDRGESRLLVVSSAQSGPMIVPYVRSGQVDGMVTGLDGSAPIEQANSGRPGMARRYWDAYGFGLLAAVLMITIGSLWSLVSGWQALRKEEEQG